MTSPLRQSGAALAACLVLAMFAGPACPDEPAWDKDAAKKYLDRRTEAWLGWSRTDRGEGTRCISCHTPVPMVLARLSLGEATDPEKRVIASVKARVGKWDKIAAWESGTDKIRPFYGEPRKGAALATESVLNALVLVNHDLKRNAGKLSDAALKALDILWATQNEKGSWAWLDFELRPWEMDAEYYGAALAAGTVGKAGKAYYGTARDKEAVDRKLARLRKYLKDGYAEQSPYYRLWALWASTLLPDLLSPAQQRKLAREVLDLDRKGDAWALTTLGKWDQKHAIPDDTKYDGYATALVVYVLKRAGAAPDEEKLSKARAWLVKHQVAEGKGPVIYLNKKRDPASADPDKAMVGKFMRDAAAAYAVLALQDTD